MREQPLSPVWLTWEDMECSFALCNICPVALRWQKRIGSSGGSSGSSAFPLALKSSISPAPNCSRTAIPTLPASQNSPHPLRPLLTPAPLSTVQSFIACPFPPPPDLSSYTSCTSFPAPLPGGPFCNPCSLPLGVISTPLPPCLLPGATSSPLANSHPSGPTVAFPTDLLTASNPSHSCLLQKHHSGSAG